MDKLIDKAIDHVVSGRHDQARNILVSIIKNERYHLGAWKLLYSCVSKANQRDYCRVRCKLLAQNNESLTDEVLPLRDSISEERNIEKESPEDLTPDFLDQENNLIQSDSDIDENDEDPDEVEFSGEIDKRKSKYSTKLNDNSDIITPSKSFDFCIDRWIQEHVSPF